MDLDPSRDQLNSPLTPMSQGMDTSNDLRMSVDEEEDNKVKFSGGVREITSRDTEFDGARQDQEKEISAEDRISSHYTPKC